MELLMFSLQVVINTEVHIFLLFYYNLILLIMSIIQIILTKIIQIILIVQNAVCDVPTLTFPLLPIAVCHQHIPAFFKGLSLNQINFQLDAAVSVIIKSLRLNFCYDFHDLGETISRAMLDLFCKGDLLREGDISFNVALEIIIFIVVLIAAIFLFVGITSCTTWTSCYSL